LSDRPDEGAVLDRRTLNRTLLARQLLLDRVDGNPLELVERLVGMQSQVPLDPYVACWTRLRAFDPDVLGTALLERRMVRMTLLRATLHLVSSADALRLRPLLQGMLERAFASSPFARELAGLELAPVLARGAELVERTPLTLAQLREALGEEWPERDSSALAYAVRYLAPLVQVTPRGVWGMTMQPTVTTLACWLGRESSADASLDELVLRYLRAFGPASPADIRTWSWLTDIGPVLERLRPDLRTYHDEVGRVLHDVDDGVFADASTSVPVRLLGQYDNVFLSHADRGRIADTVKWDASFTHRGAVLLDGFLAGSWKLLDSKSDALLAVEIRAKTRPPQRRQIQEEAEAIVAFLAPDARTRRVTLEAM
jgi:hypothetical protein